MPRGGLRAGWTTGLALLALAAPALAGSLQFRGLGQVDADRVEIRLDAPARPVDVDGSFTVELFLRMPPGSNGASDPCTGANDRWIVGNIALDRDVFGPGDLGDWGLSFLQGRAAFGVSVGGAGATACGATDLRDGQWHHLALTRDGSSGLLRVFVDGQADGQAAGAAGGIAYRDGRATSWPASDPFLVLGSEKHFGPAAFEGWMDELRISRSVRYLASFTPPSAPFTGDADTVALYGFDEGSGTRLGDRSGAPGGPSDGLLRVGGDPAGPVWSADSPFGELLYADGFESAGMVATPGSAAGRARADDATGGVVAGSRPAQPAICAWRKARARSHSRLAVLSEQSISSATSENSRPAK